uniref:TMP-TENI-domain-containing protein n=1 Tax=Mycena chlorophos TaxID=658473 RepID=A0ABQ0M2T2_MYCCL|nr:TMP-TENI-domain-containing protein [Mycena chlorophos]
MAAPTPAAEIAPAPSVVRVVPGAPPPKDVSKAPRKKRKPKAKGDDAATDILESSTAALVETAPSTADIQNGAVAADLIVEPEAADDSALKPSPLVDLITKRLKATSKKIGRISAYATTDPETLNEDQKATLKTLPALEAVQKELIEVKKAVEVYEAQVAAELAQTRRDAEQKENERVAAAVAEAKRAVVSQGSNLVNFLRLRPILANNDVSGLDHNEVNAVFSAGNILFGEQSEAQEALVSGFLLGDGSHEGVPYTRFWDITALVLNPPAPSQETDSEPVEEVITSTVNPPLGLSTTGSFDFMQASELEQPFEENAEWVERADVEVPLAEEPVNDVVADETSNAAIDWADEDEGGLPPIASLAKFGSGSATPVVEDELQTNGHIGNPVAAVSAPIAAVEEDDGFTTARGRGQEDLEEEIVASVEGIVVGVVIAVAAGENGEATALPSVTVVQLREKHADTAEFLRIAQETKALTDKYNVPLIINDRVDIACAVKARGVHLGQSDLPIAVARTLLPAETIIGISCNSVEEVRRARDAGADYVGLGAVWDTQTKTLTNPPVGVRGLGAMLHELDGTNVRAVAIGGIKSSNLARLLRGAVSETNHRLDGVAVVSDIVASLDPGSAARRLRTIFHASKKIDIPASLASSQEEILDGALALSDAVRKSRPIVHQITNFVVANQSANMTLALGASPIMATAPEEMSDLSKISGALLVNIGTLVNSTLDGMLEGGFFANSFKKPVVLDPVGLGASSFRKSSLHKLLDTWQPTVIKGNAGELAALVNSQEATGRGVDSVGGFTNPAEVVRAMANKERCVIVLSGKTDYVSDGHRVVAIDNGHPLLGAITGSGCMLGSCIAAFCAAANASAIDEQNPSQLTRGGDFLAAAVGGILTLTVASELAAKRDDVHGMGTFLPALIDEVSNLRPEVIRQFAKVTRLE